jgi:general secretion pathway protein K
MHDEERWQTDERDELMTSPANMVARKNEQGTVLVAVLWLVTVITLLVVSLGRDVRSNVDLARLEIDRLRTQAVLESAVEVAVAKLLTAGNKINIAWDGRAENINLGSASVEIRIVDASGLVDIARAKPDLLQALFDKVLGAGADSDALVEAILDRQPKGERKPSAELPFQSVDEVYELANGNSQLVDKLMPFIGLYSRDGRVNVRSGPQEVIESVPGISTTDIDNILSLRRGGDANIAVFQGIAARYGKYLSVEPGNIYIVDAKVTEGQHLLAGSSIRATIALDRKNPDAPYQVVRLSW